MEVEADETGQQTTATPMFYVANSKRNARSYCARLKERSMEYLRAHPEVLAALSEPYSEMPCGSQEGSASSSEDESFGYGSESDDGDDDEMSQDFQRRGSSEENCIVIDDDDSEVDALQKKVLCESEGEGVFHEKQYEELQRSIYDKYTEWLNVIARDRAEAFAGLIVPRSPLRGPDDSDAEPSTEGSQIIKQFLSDFYDSCKIPTLQAWQVRELGTVKVAATSKSVRTLSKIGSYELKGVDFSTLLPGKWLNDEIINSYFELITMRSAKLAKLFKAGVPRCIMFNSFFYTTLNVNGNGYNYSRVSRWTRKYTDLFEYDKILVPVNQPAHWVLVVINLAKKAVEYYDSLGGEDSACTKRILRWLGDEWADKYKANPKYKDCNPKVSEWKIVYPKDIPKQYNGYDCGVFTCKNAECLSRSDTINFSQKDTPTIRNVMMYELYKGKLLLDPTDISSKYT